MDHEMKELEVFTLPVSRIYEKENEFDGTLPDYLPNIERPVRVNARHTSCEIVYEADKATVRGTISYELLYESDYKGKLKCVTFTGEYSQKTELRRADALSAAAYVSVVSCVCKMLNARKVLIRSHIVCELRYASGEKCSVLAPSQHDCCVQTSECAISKTVFVPAKEFILTDTFATQAELPPIGDVITVSCEPINTSCVCSNGFVTVSGELKVNVLYEHDNEQELNCAAKDIPFSYILDSDRSAETTEATPYTYVITAAADSGIDAYGESRMFNLTCRLGIALSLTDTARETFVTDIFVPGKKSAVKTLPLVCTSIGPEEKTVFNIERSFENRNGFARILDSHVTLRITDIVQKDDSCEVQALATIGVLGTTDTDTEYSESTVVFTETLPARNVISIIAVINESTVSVGAQGMTFVSRGVFVYREGENIAAQAVCAIEVSDLEPSASALTVFFPTGEDTLWDVAKRYAADPEKIKHDNPDAFRNGKASDAERIIIMR
ncbi:MAG TPA: DUF3794 domain-containing protein [Bacillota bacterium]|nr:DUF3794 domain-containing protein [Bacillota bacterium]